MNEQYNFNDILKNSVLKMENFGAKPIIDIILSLTLALVIGLFIYYIYKKTFRGVVYSHNFNITLVLMAMITSLIIMTISTNIVLSLGMVGALSIVRFRTAIKDPLDIVFMFWAISIGISTGAGLFILSFIGSLFIGLVIVILSKRKSKDHIYLLVLHFEEEASIEVMRELKHIKYILKSKVARSNMIELTVEIKLKIDNTSFVNNISKVEGVRDASLVQYNGDYAS